jgi:hypothetical protein
VRVCACVCMCVYVRVCMCVCVCVCVCVWSRKDNDFFFPLVLFFRTGFPFIDAVMRQLATDGWIHHLARHAVACFLTRGDLFISWEHGMKVFDR